MSAGSDDGKILSTIAIGVAKGATTAVVKDFIDRMVIPFFNGRKSKTKIVSGTRRYVRNVEHKTRCVPTIAIQGGSFVLDEVYEPLRLISADGSKEFKINEYPSSLFSWSRCVAIVDSAGMGKSTLTKYVVRRCISDIKKIPLLVELRRIKPGQSIVQFICNEFLGANEQGAAYNDLISSLSDGNFIFMLDGYDEIEPGMRSQVSEEISKISSEYQYCYFWLTSRPDPALTGFVEFSLLKIKQLSKTQAFSLLRRYDKGRGLAETLIDKIKNLKQMEDFLGNPLLVTLLYKAFDYKATIPLKKNIFFRQVFDALYQDHDLSKDGAFERRKKSNLDLEDFHKVLRYLGINTFKAGKVQYTQSEFFGFVKNAVDASRVSVDASKFGADLISAVPVFVKDGDEVRWSHKAFQDYFASQYIYFDSGDARNDVLSRLFSKKYFTKSQSILIMLGELDVGLMREVCIIPFLESNGIFNGDNKNNVLIAAKFILSAADVFILKDIDQNKKESFPDVWISAFREDFPEHSNGIIRMSYYRENGVAIATTDKENFEIFTNLSSIDPFVFQWQKNDNFNFSSLRELSNKRSLKISLDEIELKNHNFFELFSIVSRITEICFPTPDALKFLQEDVAKRKEARSIESILDGF